MTVPFPLVDIQVKDKAWFPYFPLVEKDFPKIVAFTLDLLNITKIVEVSVVLSNNVYSQKLNKHYRRKDKPTNVLSFPQMNDVSEMIPSPFPMVLGDIVLNIEAIQNEAKEKSFENHLKHLFVHGLLHLLGYDHKTDEQADCMENLEIQILQNFNINNPYEIIPFN